MLFRSVLLRSFLNFIPYLSGGNGVKDWALFHRAAAAAATNVVASKDITVAGYLGSSKYTTKTGDTAKAIAAGINDLSAKTGVTASAKTQVELGLGAESYSMSLKGDNGTAVSISFSVGGSASTASDFAAGIAAFNAQSSNTGVTAEYDSTNKGIKLTHATGADIVLANTATAAKWAACWAVARTPASATCRPAAASPPPATRWAA